MRPTIYGWRREVVPPNPTTQSEIEADCDFVKLESGESTIKGNLGYEAKKCSFYISSIKFTFCLNLDGKIRKIILILSKPNLKKLFSFSKKDLLFVHDKYVEEYFQMDENIWKVIMKIFLILSNPFCMLFMI